MALYLKKELENEATIGVWQITETEDELVKLAATPTDEMEEISFIKSESLRKQRLAVSITTMASPTLRTTPQTSP